jgi:hypothetical protein
MGVWVVWVLGFLKQLYSIVAAALVCADIFSFGACSSAVNAPVVQAVDSAA